MRIELLVVLLLISACTPRATRSESYYLIKEVTVEPCAILYRESNSVCKFMEGFRLTSDTVRFVFSISRINFVDSKGDISNQDVPDAGRLGTYRQLDSIQVLITNAANRDLNVSKYLGFETLSRGLPIVFVSEEYIDRFDSFQKIPDLPGVKALASFNDFLKLVNNRDSLVLNRNLIRSESKPHVIFIIPSQYFIRGKNEVKTLVYQDGSIISVITTVNVL